jgi:hypothetical protein
MATTGEEPELQPLDLKKCTSTQCDNDQHCFLPDRKMGRRKQKGPCRACGKEPVDFARLAKRDLKDADHTVEMLKLECIRHHYWCDKRIDAAALTSARRAGMKALRAEAEAIIRGSVAQPNHPRAGRQTPWEGKIVYYAQHATACCCRRCLEVWYSISRKEDLTPEQIGYFTELVCRYILERVPGITEEGEPDWSPGG